MVPSSCAYVCVVGWGLAISNSSVALFSKVFRKKGFALHSDARVD